MVRKASSSRSRWQPSYRLHKARGCAVVTINGKNRYLGKYNSPESYEKYARLIAQWEANGEAPPIGTCGEVRLELTVSELVLRYLEHAQDYYKRTTAIRTRARSAICVMRCDRRLHREQAWFAVIAVSRLAKR